MMNKKILLLPIILFLCNIANSFEIKGNVRTEYKFDYLNSFKYRYIEEDKKYNGYFDVKGNIDLDFENNFHLINTFELRPVNKREYNGNYGKHNSIINNSTLRDDFYGHENYLKRKIHFSKYGLIEEEIYFKYKEEAFLFGIGKFNPTFGYAYDSNRLNGIYGNKLAEDYELKENIGTFIAFDSDFFVLRGNFFYQDNSFLSEDIFQRRGINKAEYGAGNTKKLNNFSVSSDFIYDDTKLSASFRRLAVSKKEEKAEKGYLIAIQKYIEEEEYKFGFNPLLEFAYFTNFNGIDNRDITFATVSIPLFYKGWNMVGSYTLKNDDEKGFSDYRSYLGQISVGYKFKNGICLDVAKKWEKDARKVSDLTNTKEVSYFHSWGIDLSYNFNF